MLEKDSPARPDVIAWFKARQRASASDTVAQERLIGAINALSSQGCSIRQIAAILDIPQTRVVRTKAGHPTSDVYQPAVGTMGHEILPMGSEVEAYWAANHEAWSHQPEVQHSSEFALSGLPFHARNQNAEKGSEHDPDQ